MASYTEKVLLSGTALSFLFYECINSVNTQEGFLIGDVTSEITNHISDSHSDNARLDTHIIIKTILPLPSVSLFYSPTGRIKENVLSEMLSNVASSVVGWYKYRRSTNIKPTFRDKLISKGLQKYFEKHHFKKNFVTCNVINKISSGGSTHTFTYRFGKINCFEMYEYVDDVTANLGEKLSGYKKEHKMPPNCTFNQIVQECNILRNNTNDAILCIQEAVNQRLVKEAQLAAKNENTIRELEAEIKQMNSILSDKQEVDLQAAYDQMLESKLMKQEEELANAYVHALKTPERDDLNEQSNLDAQNHVIEVKERSPSPILMPSKQKKTPVLNYAAALKHNVGIASSSKSNDFSEDLIKFDDEEKQVKNVTDWKSLSDSSPEY